MRNLRILGVAALGLFVLAQTAMSGARGARGGMRGAVVGGMVGGSDGAATGAKIGVVTGATRSAIDREAAARTQYQGTAEYQNARRSNFNDVPPEVLGIAAAAGTAAKPKGESVISKDGKPLVGITFPADWKQKLGENYVSAVSGDGQAYAMLATLGGADKLAGIKTVKAGLENYLKAIKYDEQSETKGGSLIVTGTGIGKKAGVEVVFAVGVFDAAKGELVGAAFVVDAKMDDHYKETVRGICQTLRRADDFGKK